MIASVSDKFIKVKFKSSLMVVGSLEKFLFENLDQLPFSSILRKIYFLVKRYIIFIFGGFLGWLILISVTVFIVNIFQTRPYVGYSLGLTGAIIFAFSYHRYITFKQKTNWQPRFMKFAPLEISLSGLNWLFFYLVTEFLGIGSGIGYITASFFITWFISIINFSLNRFWVFKH